MSTIPIKNTASKGKKKLTPKQKLVREQAEKRQKTEKLVLHWQDKLYSHQRISARTLCEAAKVLQPQTYEEVVEERAVQDYCGYPLCHRTPEKQRSRFRISLAQRKVFDQTELASFCSNACYQKSLYYSLQLSEDPVWARDLSAAVRVNVVPMEQDVKEAIEQERKNVLHSIPTQKLRQDYVQQLLATVPAEISNFKIMENQQNDSQRISMPTAGVYDAIEGYRIEAAKNGQAPTTMVLKKEYPSPPPPLSMDNEEALIEDAMETMLRLRGLQLDQDHEKPAVQIIRATQPEPEAKSTTTTPLPPTNPQLTKPAEKSNTKVIHVTTKVKTKTKKSKAPQMSLFGEIWTIVDRMTTQRTRHYLANLKNQAHHGQEQISEPDYDSENIRAQIFSEKILETFAVIRAQIGLTQTLETDFLDLIKTFRFSDASMVVLGPAQTYMMTLVLFKALADETLEGMDWQPGFDNCCQSIGQTTDVVNACVRVLRVAST